MVVTHLEEHVDHCCDNGGRLVDLVEIGSLSIGIVVCLDIFRMEPFSNDKNVHPTKERKHEAYLRNEFKEEVKTVLEMERVKTFEDNTDAHLDDGKNDCSLHLEVICVRQQLITETPHWIKTERINTVNIRSRVPVFIRREAGYTSVDLGSHSKYLNCLIIAGIAKDLKWHRKELVVNETIEKGKEAHQ